MEQKISSTLQYIRKLKMEPLYTMKLLQNKFGLNHTTKNELSNRWFSELKCTEINTISLSKIAKSTFYGLFSI